MTDHTLHDARPHWRDRETWKRGLTMLLVGLVFWVAEFLLLVTALVQFGFVLFTGARNERLLEFGEGLSRLFYEAAAYLTFATEDKPYPFSDWPGAD